MRQRIACAVLFWLLLPLSHGQTVAEAIQKIRPSIVQIRWNLRGITEEGKKRFKQHFKRDATTFEIGSAGTGFIVNLDGHIVTAAHVLVDIQKLFQDCPAAQQIILVTASPGPDALPVGSTSAHAIVAGVDTAHDLGLLRVHPKMLGTTSYQVRSSQGTIERRQIVAKAVQFVTHVSEGEQIAVSGYPFLQRVPQMVTNVGWLASGLIRSEVLIGQQAGTITDALYLGDVRINPGNSGAPAYLTRDGSVFGVVSANYSKMTNLAFIVPAKHVVELLQKHGIRWSSVDGGERDLSPP